MSIFDLNPKELIQMGLTVERNGAAFYKALAGSVENEDVKDIFKFLESEEKRHIVDFNHLLGEFDHEDFKKMDEEESAYLNAVASTHIFSDIKGGKEFVKEFEDDLEALFYAVGFEKDSIIFYEELKRFAKTPAARAAIVRLIQQEKEHVVKLHRLITEIRPKKRR